MFDYTSQEYYSISTGEVVGGQFQHNLGLLHSYIREQRVGCVVISLSRVQPLLHTELFMGIFVREENGAVPGMLTSPEPSICIQKPCCSGLGVGG